MIDVNYFTRKNKANFSCSGVSTVSTCDSDGSKIADTQSRTSSHESLATFGYDYLQKTDIPRPQAPAADKWQRKRNNFVIESLKMQQLHDGDMAQFASLKPKDEIDNRHDHVGAKKHVTFAIDFDLPQTPKHNNCLPEYGYWSSSLCA